MYCTFITCNQYRPILYYPCDNFEYPLRLNCKWLVNRSKDPRNDGQIDIEAACKQKNIIICHAIMN